MPQASREYLAISRQLLSNLLTLEGFPLWHAHTLRAFWLLIFPGGSTLAELFALAVSLAGLGAFLRLWWKQRVHPSLVYAAAIGWTAKRKSAGPQCAFLASGPEPVSRSSQPL